MAYFDRFDICEAYYVFLTNYHKGQDSNEYRRLSRMLRYFKPRQSLSFATLSDNGLEILQSLVKPQEFGEYSEAITYVNQSWFWDDQLQGEWYYCDDDLCRIYYGSFGNYNSPGASGYVHCEDYTREEYEREKAKWEAMPEFEEETSESE